MNEVQLELDKDNLFGIQLNSYKVENKFAVAYTPTKKNEIVPATHLNSCREAVCDQIRAKLNYYNDFVKKFDVKKTKLLVYTKFLAENETQVLTKAQKNMVRKFKCDHKKEMLIGLKILNLFEKEFKWPITKIYSVRCDQLDEKHVFYYFVGSGKWIKSPHLFSLFMLLIRTGKSIEKRRMFRTLNGFYKSLYKNTKTVDINYMKTHYKRCLLVMKYYNKLFGKTTMHDLYIPYKRKNFFAEGINTLCDLDTSDSKLLEKFSSVLKKEKKLEKWEKEG